MISLKDTARKVLTAIFLLVFFVVSGKELLALTNASDRISISWPGVPSNHTVTFKTVKEIPPGGRIVLTLESGKFYIPPFFSYEDLDMAVSPAQNGIYVDRDLATSTNAGIDRVSVVSSTTEGVIEIVLDDTMGIEANEFVRFSIGSNALYGATGTNRIINPESSGSYKIDAYTYDNSGNYLERTRVMIAVNEPVRSGNGVLKNRSNGTPAGVLNFGTVQAILSLMTNYRADCRYTRTASTSFYSMPDPFTNTGDFYHSTIIRGIGNGGVYNYYVRCIDTEGAVDTTDYVITFKIAGYEGQGGDQDTQGTPGSGGSGGPGTGGGSGGGSGNVSGGGAGPMLPYPPEPNDPQVIFQGFSYPSSKVVMLKDGVEDKSVSAEKNGSFEISIIELPQGMYTFGFTSQDSVGRTPAAKTYTFYIKEGTKTNLNNIILSPTIEIPAPSLKAGDSLKVLGQSAPDANIDLWVYPKMVGIVPDASIVKKTGKSGANGEWTFDMAIDSLPNGPYMVKARSSIKDRGQSEFSKVVEIAVGGEVPKQSTCDGADLNGDGKVNITDFSILLYWWNKDNDCADQNNDKVVNLIDFSIMMYNWTG